MEVQGRMKKTVKISYRVIYFISNCKFGVEFIDIICIIFLCKEIIFL